ncbi:PAS domain-containing protein [Hymenobacter metallicola]|uniref:histidine kinase n=1 Tax=Hymenobacter metallicola TaxID=2563114 RepID=A0A4Z0QDC8_9BACT|nr:PAS domain-containing protein [Hymenobacter metallicola]TGE28108.1 PAS domain S-box protein [Hymenobacter metallicola]
MPPTPPAADSPFKAFFDLSPTPALLLEPVYDAAGEVVDFSFFHLNPAAQHLLELPAQPRFSYRSQFADGESSRAWALLQHTFGTASPAESNASNGAFGLDNTYQLRIERAADQLLVRFTPDPAVPGVVPEEAQALTQELVAAHQELETALTLVERARAEAELQRQQLHSVFEQAPAMICLLAGPQHVFQFVNPPYQALVGNRPLVGKPIAEAMPELAGQPIFDLLDQVYATGETFYAHEMLVQLDHQNEGLQELEKRYYNFIYQARRDVAGVIDGILVFAYEVSAQVLARQQAEEAHKQVQALNEELAAINEELQAANEEYSAANEALSQVQQELVALNQQLEARVSERTRQIQEQSGRLERLIKEAPAAIVVLDGPEWVVELLNPEYEALFPDRNLGGKPILEGLPELVEGPGAALLRQVYETGVTFEGREVLMPFARPGGDELEERYFDFIYQARHDSAGHINGLVVFGFEVTDKVRSRQQAVALQAELLAAAERQVQERETLYQVFAMTPAAICIQRGPEHRYTYANQAYYDFFPGRPLLGRSVAEALPETVESGVVDLLDHVYRTGETYYGNELPLLIAQPDGSLRQMYFTFTYQAYRENGQIVGISTFAYNVAEQVEARQERDAYQQQLQELFLQAPAPIVILDGPELVFQLVNPAYQRIFPGRELAGKPLLEALPELVGTPIPDLFQRVYQTGEPVTVRELPLMMARYEGAPPEEIYWTFTYQARRDGQGRIDGVRVFAHDVTEQVHTRRQVEATAERLRLLTDALPVLISYVDRERRYQFTNEAYRTWFNQNPAALLGRPAREIIGEEAYAVVVPYMDRALAGERLSFTARMPYREDLVKYIQTDYIPEVRAGEVIGFYTLVADITEQVKAREQVQGLNEELAAINEELQASNKELLVTNQQLTRTNIDLDTFIYTASHDLKQPIANIEGILLALREHLREIEPLQNDVLVAQLLGMLQQTVTRFQLTITQLTDITKLQLAHTGPAEAVELAAVVEEVLHDLAPAIQAAKAEVEVKVPPGLLVSFSPANLRSIVYNLLSNAVKYRSPDRPARVWVRAVRTDQAVLFTVQDNGLGVSELQQRQLFGLFQRLHTHVEGTGVGLYIVKRLLENAGGSITIHSQPDAGATFTVSFPG